MQNLLNSVLPLLMLLLVPFGSVSCGRFLIIPTQNSVCFSKPCLTLSQFANHSIKYINSSTTLAVTGGGHNLDSNISVSNVEEFYMLPVNNTDPDATKFNITCIGHSRFIFSNVSHVYIGGVIFTGCDGIQFDSVGQLTIENSKFVGQHSHLIPLTVGDCTDANITSTDFVTNRANTNTSLGTSVGGALIVSHSNVMLSNCTFKGNSANNGGAIFSESTSNITINNCTFISNHATDHNCGNKLCLGGAMFINGTGAVIIRNSTFKNNTSGRGGAVAVVSLVDETVTANKIMILPSAITVETTVFTNNSANFNGGAIYVSGSNVTITKSSFSYNEADRVGGAIASNISSSVRLSSSSFLSNIARMNGGAIAIEQNSSTFVENSSIRDNIAHNNGGVVDVQCYSRIELAENCTISNNSAGENGGVISAGMESFVSVDGCSVCNNKAKESGGVFHAEKSTNIIITNSKFINNAFSSRGGVIKLSQNSTSTMNNSIFSGNKAKYTGVFHVDGLGSRAVVSNSSFSYNKAREHGGVATARFEGEIIINDSLFCHNYSPEGGVISGFNLSSVKVYRSNFNSNKALRRGGVVLTQHGSTFNAEDSVFNNNVDVDVGAVIKALNGTSIEIRNCNFSNNSANYGGAVESSMNNTITIFNSRFYNNTANNNGGVLFARIQGRIIIVNSSFVCNKAINDGVMVAADGSYIRFNSSTFRDNIVGHDGGVAYAYNRTNITINGCTLVNNKANNSGGIVYMRSKCIISIFSSLVSSNKAQSSGGGVHAQDESHISVKDSNFSNNSADYGGGFRVYVSSTAVISNNTFSENEARIAGGAMAAYERSTIKVYMCNFMSNMADDGGVAIAFQNVELQDSNATKFNLASEGGGSMRQRNVIDVKRSSFKNNSAANSGGVIYVQGSAIVLQECSFDQNSAIYDGGNIKANRKSFLNISDTNFTNGSAGRYGGVLSLSGNSRTEIQSCTFSTNRGFLDGGVVHQSQSTANISNSYFSSSIANRTGGVLTALKSSLLMDNNTFVNNTAYRGGVVYASTNSLLEVGGCQFISNIARYYGGALYSEKSSNSCLIDSIFYLNSAKRKGGAVFATDTSKFIIALSTFRQNIAELGAAMFLRKKSFISFDIIHVNLHNVSTTSISYIQNNTATRSGGGIYVNEGELHFGMEVEISHNQANETGGGIHAINSTITIGGNMHFTSNQADNGGGMSLQNSKFELGGTFTPYYVNFMLNHANLGGALYIDDESEESTCSNNPYTGELRLESSCFFQNVSRGLMINFYENYANKLKNGGDNLYGGLLDRCTVVSETNSSRLEVIGAVRFKEISNITTYATIASKPVRLCLCKNDSGPECDQQLHHIKVINRNSFKIFVAAVDQVNQTVVATVHSRFNNTNSTLAESQSIRRIGANCSNLDYRISFPNESETYDLVVYPEGPCDWKGSSGLILKIHVVSCTCPHGFVPADTDLECDCVCDSRYKLFSRECNLTLKSVTRRGLFWMAYFNDSKHDLDSYFIYPFCPFDYCQPPSVSVQVNLNLQNGSDTQCTNNRGGLLCGTCKPTYSLSLGSSRCIKCSNKWHGWLGGILITSLLCGIILVFFLLLLNLTVAVGTLNSIIFYANIVNVNRSVYFSQFTLVSVFISWLNLDVGLDTCFYEGMDTYVKTWLQLAFPLYIILLVVLIILVSSYSSRFSNLIGKKDPVATLATLILLSYTKLLQVVIASFSFATVKYPNGTFATLWLPDANIKYTDGKTIVLVVVAIVILILGLLYTTTIFSWQWLLQLSRWKSFAWTRNQKIHTFINTYHNPYSTKHRYWTGLLLLVRVVLYLICAFSISIDPRIVLLSTVVIVCCLTMYKTLWIVRVYKNKLLNAMESFVFFNIATFAVITLYNFNEHSNKSKEVLQLVSAYVSVGTVLILCLVVILAHAYRYGNSKIYTLAKTSKISKRLADFQLLSDPSQYSTQTESNLLDVLDHPRSEDGFNDQQLNQTITTSVLSLTECEEALDSTYHLEESEEQNCTNSQVPNIKGKTLPPYSEDSEFAVTSESRVKFRQKSEISLTSFNPGSSHDDMKKPLLEEETRLA